MASDYIKRWLYFYELKFEYSLSEKPESICFIDFWEHISKNSNKDSAEKFKTLGEKDVYLRDVIIDSTNRKIKGKIISIRTDALPEIGDRRTGQVRDMNVEEWEDVIETTHFVMDYSKQVKRLCIEFNQFGPRFQELINCLIKIGHDTELLENIGWVSSTRDDLNKLKARIGIITEFVVKVDKSHLYDVEKISGLLAGMSASQEKFSLDYIMLKLKFDYKSISNSEVQNEVMKLIDMLTLNKRNIDLFNKLSVRAQDYEKNKILNTFDLLVDRVKSQVNVLRKEKHRTIVTSDMFEKMYSEIIKLGFI